MNKSLRILVIAAYTIIGPLLALVLFVASWPAIAKAIWRADRHGCKSSSSTIPKREGAEDIITHAPAPQTDVLARDPLPVKPGDIERSLARGDIAIYTGRGGNC